MKGGKIIEKLTLTVKEAAKALGISTVSVYKLINRENHPIPSMKFGSSKKARRLISREALRQWIAEETEMTMKGRG